VRSRAGRVFVTRKRASVPRPCVLTFYERLRRAGKPTKLALTACMRKLVVTLNAVLRTGTAWKQA
jgi:transposase